MEKKKKQEKCDKCGSDILMGRCSCGEWYENGKAPPLANILEKAILEFNKTGSEVLSGDHHSGSCIILFKGDHKKCMKVKKFVEELE